MNQHSTSPWPGDDICKGEPKGKSLCSAFEYLEPVDKSEVLVSRPNDGI